MSVVEHAPVEFRETATAVVRWPRKVDLFGLGVSVNSGGVLWIQLAAQSGSWPYSPVTFRSLASKRI